MKNNQLSSQTVSYEVGNQTIELQSETVKQYLVHGNGTVTDQEVLMFMNLCQYQALNPFINEAYLVKFGQGEKAQPAQIIVSKEAFMKRAESHKEFEGFEAGIVYEINGELHEVSGAIKPKQASLLGGWCKVYRNDRQKPIEVKVSYEEFSKGQATWKAMPLNMIRKVAIVNGLREAFPNTLGAMYTEEETNKSRGDDIPEYKPNERKDVTPKSEIIEPEEQQPNELETAKAQMVEKFKILGIKGTENKRVYIEKSAPQFDMNNPELSKLQGLLDIMDMHIDLQESGLTDDLE